MASAEPVYCLCRLPYDVTRFMIECDVCKDWFHGSCVGVEEHAAIDIDLYHCPNCAKLYGPSVMRRRRHQAAKVEVLMDVGSGSIGGGMTGDGQPVHTGSPVFIKELKSRMFPSADEILLKPHGSQLSMQFLEQSGFDLPILVAKRDGLGLAVPSTSFSVCDVEQHIGGDRIIDVIDVARQAGIKMTLHEFVQFYTNPNRSSILNVISLEFSNTRLSPLVEPPDVVRQLSWVENHWPQDAPYPTPRVDKYCLMGVKDSYTDFHIDFGGTSVWYHVLKGEKIFYLIKPTNANLALYERWSISSNQNEMFFGDQVDKCYRCVVKQGQTLFIPTGWIHAVLTPVDCIAFGGNFLHNLNIALQFRVSEMEKRLKTADMFAFPNFETLCWYTAQSFLDTFRELRSKGTQPPAYLIQGTKSLNSTLRSWTRKEVLAEHEVDIPDDIIYSQLTKDLAKEVRMAENPIAAMGKSVSGVASAFSIKPWDPEPLLLEPGLRSVRVVPCGGALSDTEAEPGEIIIGESRRTVHTRGMVISPRSARPHRGRKGKARGGNARGDGKNAPHSPRKARQIKGVADPGIAIVDDDRLRLVVSNGKIIGRGVEPATGPAVQAEVLPLAGGSLGLSLSAHDAYDYDSDDDRMLIDEGPARRRRGDALGWGQPDGTTCTPTGRIGRFDGHRELALSVDDVKVEAGDHPGGEDCKDANLEPGSESNAPRGVGGSILDLLKASREVCSEGEPPSSPSTHEAIQGMLSMAGLQASSAARLTWGLAGVGSVAREAKQGKKRRKGVHAPGLPTEEEESEEDDLEPCFKDSDYVYPSLESEDEEPVFKSRAKKRRSVGDAPWNPGAKVVPSFPRPERPVREGTRVPSIETGLAVAAAKLSQQPASPGGQEQQKPQKKKPAKRKPSLSTQPPAQLSVEKEEVLPGETLVEQHASPEHVLTPEPRTQVFFFWKLGRPRVHLTWWSSWCGPWCDTDGSGCFLVIPKEYFRNPFRHFSINQKWKASKERLGYCKATPWQNPQDPKEWASLALIAVHVLNNGTIVVEKV
uniref:histone lysine demethylase PHF8-like isoform X3 n=1 Tax=Myxine glutinosa TaxID=7769 RepID=UPI00358F12BC